MQFDLKDTGEQVEIIHSLAKWKRMALRRYGYGVDEGIYTDMNAIRRDEEMDNLHSIYVDPVSYTHLDVYKRQVCGRGDAG